jgi:hypothetical protein
MENRFFLYEGEILRAANYKLHEVLKYWESGRKVFYGNPDNHTWDITRAAQKLSPNYRRNSLNLKTVTHEYY